MRFTGRMLLLCLTALLFLAPGARGEDAFLDWMPQGARQALEAAYPGHTLLDGAAAGLESGAAVVLAVIDTGANKLACLLEVADGHFYLRAENDPMIDDGPYNRGNYWLGLRDDQGYGFIWYTNREQPQQERYYSFSLKPGWPVGGGHFGEDGGENAVSFGDQGGVMAVRSHYGVYSLLPHQLDLRFSAFDPQAVFEYCQWAWEQVDSPLQLVPTTGKADALPQGQHVEGFKKGRTIPVYSGPGTHYARAGEGKAAVSTNGWIQVFGQEDGWLLIQYNIGRLRNRFGWIGGKYLPQGVTVKELTFQNEPAVVSGWGTEDPLRISAEVYFPNDEEGLILGTLGEDWQYVAFNWQGAPVRAFVPTGTAIPRSLYHGTATVRVSQAPLEDDRGRVIGRYFGGARLKVLARQGERVRVEVADGHTGWLALSDLALDTAPKDVPLKPPAAQICLPDGEQESLYAAPSAAAPRVSAHGPFFLLGEVRGFAQVMRQYGEEETVYFCPEDWLLPLPEGDLPYARTQRMTLKRDCPVVLRPGAGANSVLTLYQHSAIEGADLGNGWFLMLDNNIAWDASMGDAATYGYLPMDALTVEPQTASGLPMGLLRPEKDRDLAHLLVNRRGSIQSPYAWGARFALLGETQQHYLVRSPGGDYGYLPRAEVERTDDTCPQDAPGQLHLGSAVIRLPGGTAQQAAYTTPYPNWKGQGGETVADGQPVRLVANLGEWWQLLSRGDSPAFVPAAWLTGLPEDAPAYAGIYNAFRDLPFMSVWWLTPPLVLEGELACALLKSGEEQALAWYTYAEGAWVPGPRVEGVLGPGLRVFSGFSLEEGELSLTAYLQDSNVSLRSAFRRAAGTWRLAALTLEGAMAGDEPEQQPRRVVRPTAHGITMEQGGHTTEHLAVLPPDSLEQFRLTDWVTMIERSMKGE